MASYDYPLKILLLGAPSTGKDEFAIRYISGFPLVNDLKLTIGVDFYSKTQEFRGKKVKLQIWNFGSEERFIFLLHQYCKGASGAFIMYDITNRLSLDHLPDWTQIIREHAGDIPIILIGNKLDLEKSREVSKEEGILTAEKYNLSAFSEVSAKTGQNVEKAFDLILEMMLSSSVETISKYKRKKKGENKYIREKRKVKISMKDKKLDDKMEEYIRHLEKRTRNLETEKQLLDAERLRLEQEVNSLRNEIDRLRAPPLVAAVVLSVEESTGRVTVLSSTGPLFVVNPSRKVRNQKLEPGMFVSLNQRTFAIMDILSITKE